MLIRKMLKQNNTSFWYNKNINVDKTIVLNVILIKSSELWDITLSNKL